MEIQSENIAFGLDQMVGCTKCGRPNPPNRASCLYCAAALEIPSEMRGAARLNLRKLENWENGFNIVLLSQADGPDAASAAAYLKIEKKTLDRMLASPDPMPLARIESEAEAELAVERLAELGLTTTVVRDVELKIGKPNTRLRSIEFAAEDVCLTAFNTGESTTVAGDRIALIVIGHIFESEKESIGKGKKEKREMLAESASSSDDVLIDIYTADSAPGWRLTTKGFDFSTLGSEKRLLAAENIRIVLNKLITSAHKAKVADAYTGLIGPLSEVWEIDRRTDFEGIKRVRAFKSGFSTVERTSNLDQFTRYSRLQRILL